MKKNPKICSKMQQKLPLSSVLNFASLAANAYFVILSQNGKYPEKYVQFSKNFRFFLKFFSKLKLSQRAPGMSDFDARGLIRQEIVHIFRILIKHKSHNYLHTCGTQKAHHTKKSIFVPVVCSSQCA